MEKSREEIIKEQAHWLANKFSVRNGYTSTEEILIEMAQFIDNNQPSPWVSVEERLPEEGQAVLALLKYGNHTTCNYIDGKFVYSLVVGSTNMKIQSSFNVPLVSHWMPIPPVI